MSGQSKRTDYWRAPRLWTGETVVCICRGPSLTPEQVEQVRGGARVIAVNNAYELAPWADVMYGADAAMWRHYWPLGAAAFPGMKVTLDAQTPYPEVKLLRRRHGPHGESQTVGGDDDPAYLRGNHSGMQAAHLAYHLGARRIVLLGYDLQQGPDGRSHDFGEHPEGVRRNSPYREMTLCMATLLGWLWARGVEVVNCTRTSALDAVCPKASLGSALHA